MSMLKTGSTILQKDSFIQKSQRLFNEYTVTAILNTTNKTANIIFEHQKTKEPYNPIDIIEIKNKLKMILSNNLSPEIHKGMLTNLKDSIEEIDKYLEKLKDCLKSGFFPEVKYLTPLILKDCWEDEDIIYAEKDNSNVKSSFNVVFQVDASDSLTKKRVSLDEKLSLYQERIQGDFKNLQVFEIYLKSFFFGQRSLGLTKTKFLQYLCSICSEMKDFHSINQRISEDIFVDFTTELLKNLEDYFIDNKEELEQSLPKHPTTDEEKKLSDQKLNLIHFSECSEWKVLNWFISNYLEGRAPPASHIYFCSKDSNFIDLEGGYLFLYSYTNILFCFY